MNDWNPNLDFLEFVKEDGVNDGPIVVDERELSWGEFVAEMKSGTSAAARSLYDQFYKNPSILERYEAWKKNKGKC